MRSHMIITMIILLLLLSSCNSRTGRESGSSKIIKRESFEHRLLDKASPGTSALTIYRYDGQNCVQRTVFDQVWEKQVIEVINALKLQTADEDELSNWGEPCYGIKISDTDGMEIRLTYHDGLWLEKDGSLYYGECDLEKYFEEAGNLADTSEQTADWGAVPNNAILKKYDLKYCRRSTAEVCADKDGVSLGFISFKDNVVTLKYRNNSDKSFQYGEEFALHEYIDGEWYVLSPVLSNYSFIAIAYRLGPGREIEVTCNLEMFGELEKGHYRIVKKDLCAEFDVK